MKVLIGVDPHKASVAVAVVDEVVGEFVECATFPQNRAGLRSLQRSKRNGSPNVVGRWRTRAVSVGTWQGGCPRPASRWWTCRPSFRHGCGHSRAATPARTMGSMPSPLRWPPRATSGWRRSIPRPNRRCCACSFREARRSGGRAYPGAQPPARASTGPRPRRGNWDTLSPPGRTHRARHTAPGYLGPPPPTFGFGDLARHPDTAAKDRGPKRAHRSRGGGFRHHPHRDLRRRSHTGRQDHRHGRQRGALPDQGPLCLLLRYGAGGGFEWGDGKA